MHAVLYALAVIGALCVLSTLVVGLVVARVYWFALRHRPVVTPSRWSYGPITPQPCSSARHSTLIPLAFFPEPERRALMEAGAKVYRGRDA